MDLWNPAVERNARDNMRALQLEKLKRQLVRVHRGDRRRLLGRLFFRVARGNAFRRGRLLPGRDIDQKTLEVLPFEDGVEGEIVYTVLDKECAPLVRWRDKDIVQVFTEPAKIGLPGFRFIINSIPPDARVESSFGETRAN